MRFAWSVPERGGQSADRWRGATTLYNYHQPTQRLTSTNGAIDESFTYHPGGQLAGDGRGTYVGYTPAGLLATVTSPTVSASYLVQPRGPACPPRRQRRDHVTPLVLLAKRCSARTRASAVPPVWTRDVIYVGSLPLGAVRSAAGQPSVAFVAGSATVAEAAGSTSATVRLTTPGGTPTPCAVTVSYVVTPGIGLCGG